MAGDIGFDPLEISSLVPLQWAREAELKHARICMLAFAGYVSVDLGFRVPLAPGATDSLVVTEAQTLTLPLDTGGELMLEMEWQSNDGSCTGTRYGDRNERLRDRLSGDGGNRRPTSTAGA